MGSFVNRIYCGIIVILMILQGIQSSDLQEPSVKVASQVFGIQGSKRSFLLF